MKVVAFTAARIPYISDKNYSANMAGQRYPRGIPIFDERQLPELMSKHNVDDVYFSYSDVSHEYVMHLASRALASGASFHILGQKNTMLIVRVWLEAKEVDVDRLKEKLISILTKLRNRGKNPFGKETNN